MTEFDLHLGVQRLSALIAGTTDDDLVKPTPCPAYTVDELIDHIGTTALAFGGAARKERGELSEITPETYKTSPLSGDWRSRIREDLDALANAWAAPDAWDGMTRIATMDVPADQAALVAAEEVTVHSWDLARATGQPFDPDPDLVAAARRMLEPVANPNAPRSDTVPFGPPHPVAADASPLDQVIGLAGRNPAWAPA
jgi:uncharacterized protein (TIGR03086 family)